MFSKKTRNLAVTALAFIMAICVGFGVMGFNKTQEVKAATAAAEGTWDFTTTAPGAYRCVHEVGGAGSGIYYCTNQNTHYGAKYGLRSGSAVFVFYLGNDSKVTLALGNENSSSKDLTIDVYKSDENLQTFFENAAQVNSQVDAYFTGDFKTKFPNEHDKLVKKEIPDKAGSNTYKALTAELTKHYTEKAVTASKTVSVTTTKNGEDPVSVTLNEENALPAGYYYITTTDESKTGIMKMTITPAAKKTITAVALKAEDQAKTYTVLEGKEFDTSELPQTVTGTYDGGTVDVPVTWKTTDSNVPAGGKYTYTASFTTPSGYEFAAGVADTVITLEVTVTPLTEITKFAFKAGQQQTYSILEGKAFDESQLPATVDGVYEGGTVDVAVTWSTEDSGVVAGGHYTYTAKWEAAPEGYKFAADIEALTITVNVNEDERPGIESVQEIEAIVVDEDDTCPLPEKVTANLTNKTTAQVSVEWDAVSTANPGVYEIKGKIVATDEDTYKAVGNLDVTVTVKVRGAYDSPFNAKWDITEVEDGVAWDGTSGSATAITQDHMLKDAMGIQIYAAEGTFSDNEHPSAMLNCVKVDPTKSTNAIKIKVPQGFVGTISVKTGGYKTGKGNGAAWELVENNEVLQTVNFGDANTYYTSDGENTDTEDDAYILEHHYELVFNKVNAAEAEGNYTIRIKAGSTNDKMYISSVAVDGELDSAKRFFVKGDKLNSITPRYGYTFIGWADADKPELGLLEEGYKVEEDGDFFVICAKVEYLGVSFRTEGATGVRYGFILRFYDHDDRDESVNSLKTEYIKSLNISLNSVTFAADVTSASGKQKTTTITLEKNNGLNYAYNDELFGYVANLVIMNVTAAEGEWNVGVKATFSLQVGETVKELAAEGAKETIKSKAEAAYNDGAFGNKEDQAAKDWAGKYGYTVA